MRSCPIIPHNLLVCALEVGRSVAELNTHHGLLLVLGNWQGHWCKDHVRMKTFKNRSGEELQKRFKGQTLFSNEVLAYLLEMSSHPTDHDGAIGVSACHGFLQPPRAELLELQEEAPSRICDHVII